MAKKVYVGLSGGVDSSVTAALLKERGFDVTGVFIKVWQPDWIECTWKDDRRDAMRVAAKLGIAFETLNLEKEYKRDVVDYMIAEYSSGRTPNPDVMCNRHVKFGGFLKWAMAQGAAFVATGHYVRRIDRDNYASLNAAVDKNKDQSYFLWTLTQNEIMNCLFPIGDFQKSEVRKLAKKFDLITAEKKDSQGLCFIGKIEMKDFLSHYVTTKPGNVLNEKGEKIGVHDGALFYTIGQRQGFTITTKTPFDVPLYISAKDIGNNTITVSKKGPAARGVQGIQKVKLSSINWISGKKPDQEKTYLCRIRYRQPTRPCKLEKIGSEFVVSFLKPETDITPGQSLVMYDGEEMIGGGVIELV